MARIIVGAGTAKTPQVSLPPHMWPLMGQQDLNNPEVRPVADELMASNATRIAQEITPDKLQERYETCQRAIAAIGDEIARASPDILVIFGDEDRQLSRDQNMPPFSVYWGETAINVPPPNAWMETVPEHLKLSLWGWWGDSPEKFPIAWELGRHLIEYLTSQDFDVASCRGQQERVSVNSSFGFVCRRILRANAIPIVPIVINAQFPPNQPSLQRCYALGDAVRRAIETWDEDKTVGIVVSGGLSHVIINEELDRKAINSLLAKDVKTLCSLPLERPRSATGEDSGTGEVRCWVGAAGALVHLDMRLLDYVPCYRSPAGTGCAMAFALWT